MRRDLFKQIRNEWRENVWLLIELMVVCAAIWALSTVIYTESKGLLIPRGFDSDDVYCFDIKRLDPDHPAYVPVENGDNNPDLQAVTERLRRNANVGAVMLHSNGSPYNYSFYGVGLTPADVAYDSVPYSANLRNASPDIVDVLRLESITGSTPSQLKAMLERGEVLLSENDDYEEKGRDVMSLIGRKVFIGVDSTKVYRVGDVVRMIRRSDFEDTFGGMAIVSDLNVDGGTEPKGVMIRVLPGRDAQFMEDLRNNPTLTNQRNVYLSDMKSLNDLRESCQRFQTLQVRMGIILIAFLIMTVFLGLLGAFWFRVQQRISEIAIRKVCGARRSDIFRRILTEGLLLLVAAVVMVSICAWPFHGSLEQLLNEKWYVLLLSEAVTAMLIAVGIVVSLWYPASKAMQIEPATAIKDE